MRLLCCVSWCVLLVGCTQSTVDNAVTDPVVSDQTSDILAGTEDSSPLSDSTPDSGIETKLTAANTRIEFVGTHVGKDPDPDARQGHFPDFAGSAVVADDELKSVAVEIQTASITTDNEKLTNHLKSPDFFDTRTYPTATFVSSRIARNDDGDYIVNGNLTLMGTTREISFPARVGMAGGVLSLSSKLTIDRTEFGMTGLTDKVKKTVSLSITIGEAGQASPE